MWHANLSRATRLFGSICQANVDWLAERCNGYQDGIVAEFCPCVLCLLYTQQYDHITV